MNKKQIDAETAKLTTKLRDLLGTHMALFDEEGRSECVISCLVALGTNVGKIKQLAVSTGIVEADEFDNYLSGVADAEYKSSHVRYNS